MVSNNFLPFNEGLANAQSDGQYEADLQRLNGVSAGIAQIALHNKLYAQTSLMSAALGETILKAGYDALDTDFVDLIASVINGIQAQGIVLNGVGGAIPLVEDNHLVKFPAGMWASDPTTKVPMMVTSQLSLNITTSGVNGLDVGSEAADTWYYAWLIKNPTTNVVAGLLSLSPTSPTMPDGFIHKRMILPVKNKGSNFLQGAVSNWPNTLTFRPSTQHCSPIAAGNYGTLVAKTLNATTLTTLDCSTQVPVGARFANLWVRCNGALTVSIRDMAAPSGEEYAYRMGTVNDTLIIPVRLNSSRQFQYRVSTGEVAVEIFDWTL